MSTGSTIGRSPLEIRLAAGLLVAGGVAFLLVAAARSATEGGGNLFTPPLLELVLALGVGGGLLAGMRLARYAGMVLALLTAFLHAVIALEPVPVWVRIVSGLIAVSQVYVAVLLNTKPALLHSGAGGARR